MPCPSLAVQVVLRSLKRSASLKDEFIASLSHELKTPVRCCLCKPRSSNHPLFPLPPPTHPPTPLQLNGIIGTTHLLGLSGEVSGEMREHIATLSHCANALSMLVENVLEQGNTRVETKLTYLPNVNVRAFFEEAVAVVRSLGYKRGTLQVTLTVEDSVPEVSDRCHSTLSLTHSLSDAHTVSAVIASSPEPGVQRNQVPTRRHGGNVRGATGQQAGDRSTRRGTCYVWFCS